MNERVNGALLSYKDRITRISTQSKLKHSEALENDHRIIREVLELQRGLPENQYLVLTVNIAPSEYKESENRYADMVANSSINFRVLLSEFIENGFSIIEGSRKKTLPHRVKLVIPKNVIVDDPTVDIWSSLADRARLYDQQVLYLEVNDVTAESSFFVLRPQGRVRSPTIYMHPSVILKIETAHFVEPENTKPHIHFQAV